jgi:hypothetical protein
MLLNANCKAWQSSLVPAQVSPAKLHADANDKHT